MTFAFTDAQPGAARFRSPRTWSEGGDHDRHVRLVRRRGQTVQITPPPGTGKINVTPVLSQDYEFTNSIGLNVPVSNEFDVLGFQADILGNMINANNPYMIHDVTPLGDQSFPLSQRSFTVVSPPGDDHALPDRQRLNFPPICRWR